MFENGLSLCQSCEVRIEAFGRCLLLVIQTSAIADEGVVRGCSFVAFTGIDITCVAEFDVSLCTAATDDGTGGMKLGEPGTSASRATGGSLCVMPGTEGTVQPT